MTDINVTPQTMARRIRNRLQATRNGYLVKTNNRGRKVWAIVGNVHRYTLTNGVRCGAWGSLPDLYREVFDGVNPLHYDN